MQKNDLPQISTFLPNDEERMTLTGERTNIRYTIGEKVRIKVVAANKQAKTIDFKIVKKI